MKMKGVLILMEQHKMQIKNEFISEVFGKFDENIKKLESAFSVSIINRDDSIVISGDKDNVEMTEKVLSAIVKDADKGENIDEQKINYYISELKEKTVEEIQEMNNDFICMSISGRPVKPKTLGQKDYADKIRKNTIVFGIGPAGTGKTYLAMAMAITAFKNNDVSRIILTRPAIEAGENLGFLPGDMQQKVDPYLRPLYDALYEIMGADQFQKNIEKGAIEVAPLAYMRGRTLDNSFIVLDEAQNTTPEQMKMFLTRIGFGSKAVITGDVTQIDLPNGKRSGLIESTKILQGIDDIEIVTLTNKDVVRHPLVQKIINAYEVYEQKKDKEKDKEQKNKDFKTKDNKYKKFGR